MLGAWGRFSRDRQSLEAELAMERRDTGRLEELVRGA
jgi:hypothetical protein